MVIKFRVPRAIKCSSVEAANIDSQISLFLEKGIIVESSQEHEQFISTIFLREKKNGSFRMILNLKELNTWINYNHFKMDSIHTCIQLMKPHYFMGSVDLQNAYYSIPVHPAHQKYLKFAWQGKLYQFTCLAQGLASAPRLFTKIMKPVFATLRGKGHLSSSYLDDSFLVGSSYDECKANIRDTLDLLRALGFYPNEDKSVIKPTHKYNI